MAVARPPIGLSVGLHGRLAGACHGLPHLGRDLGALSGIASAAAALPSGARLQTFLVIVRAGLRAFFAARAFLPHLRASTRK